jgi:hypothetical protein
MDNKQENNVDRFMDIFIKLPQDQQEVVYDLLLQEIEKREKGAAHD